MGVVLRIFAFLGSALGLIAWLGGTALVAFALTSVMGSSPDHVTELAKVSVVVAGVVVALVASIVLLRVTRHLLWFFVCFACGAFAALAGAGFNPGSLSGSGSLLVVGALAILGVSVVVLAITKRMVPFLVCLGLLGLVGAGAGVFFGLNASAPMSTAEAPEALPTPTHPRRTPMNLAGAWRRRQRCCPRRRQRAPGKARRHPPPLRRRRQPLAEARLNPATISRRDVPQPKNRLAAHAPHLRRCPRRVSGARVSARLAACARQPRRKLKPRLRLRRPRLRLPRPKWPINRPVPAQPRRSRRRLRRVRPSRRRLSLRQSHRIFRWPN
ncbi:MAG: hypothetical protein WDN76_01200 [Alphaproteobacteria bacterium]